MRLHVRKLGLIVFCAAAATWYLKAQPAAQELAPGMAFWRHDAEFATILDMVNRSTTEAQVRLRLFWPDGSTAVDRTISVDAHSNRSVSTTELLGPVPAGRIAEAGLLLMSSQGVEPNSVLAIARTVSKVSSVSLPLGVEPQPSSRSQLGFWWRPTTGSRYDLLVANRSETAATVFITPDSHVDAPQRVTLGPRQMKTITLGQRANDPRQPGIIRLETDGAGLMAVGLITDAARGFSTTVPFSPPTLGEGAIELHGSYAPVGMQPAETGIAPEFRFQTDVLLHNPSSQDALAHVDVKGVTPSGADVKIESSAITIRPFETRVVPLRGRRVQQAGATSVVVTANRSLVAKAVAFDATRDFVIDVPLVDPKRAGPSQWSQALADPALSAWPSFAIGPHDSRLQHCLYNTNRYCDERVGPPSRDYGCESDGRPWQQDGCRRTQH